MAGRARCCTAHLVLTVLLATARCSVGQQSQYSGDAPAVRLRELLDSIASRLDGIASRLEAQDTRLDSQHTLLDGIASRLEAQDTRLDSQHTLLVGIASRLEAQDSRLDALKTGQDALNTRQDSLKAGLDALNGRLVHQNASLVHQNASLDLLKAGQDALNARVNISVAAALRVPPRDCSDLPTGVGTGIYTLRLGRGVGDLTETSAFCDMDTDGGGWTVFQRRADLLPRQDFFLEWADYRKGFGNMTGEFWWGLEKLHLLTSPRDRRYELRVELEDFDGERKHALYQGFAISSEKDGYRLTASNYSGDAGDSLRYHFGMKFSTKERDQDGSPGHCAQIYKGAWWYADCTDTNLNGVYLAGVTSRDRGVTWYHWKGHNYSLKTSEMKVRPTANV